MRKSRSIASYVMVCLAFCLIAGVLFIWVFDISLQIISPIRSGEEPLQPTKLKIGLVMNSLLEDRWQKERNVFVSRAQKLGAEVYVKTGLNDGKMQINHIKYLISKNVDVLVIIPQNGQLLKDVINEAKQKGIKVICYNSYVKDANIDLYIGADNEELGKLQAENICKTSGKGEYIVLNGSAGDTSAQEVNLGLKQELNTPQKKDLVNVVLEEWVQDFDPIYAERYVRNSLIEHENIKGIIAPNDICAGQVVKLLTERHLDAKVNVIGADAENLACKRILNGTQLGTMYIPFDDMAKTAAEWAVAFAEEKRGGAKELSKSKQSLYIEKKINTGNGELPALIFPVKYIDRNNVSEVYPMLNN